MDNAINEMVATAARLCKAVHPRYTILSDAKTEACQAVTELVRHKFPDGIGPVLVGAHIDGWKLTLVTMCDYKENTAGVEQFLRESLLLPDGRPLFKVVEVKSWAVCNNYPPATHDSISHLETPQESTQDTWFDPVTTRHLAFLVDDHKRALDHIWRLEIEVAGLVRPVVEEASRMPCHLGERPTGRSPSLLANAFSLVDKEAGLKKANDVLKEIAGLGDVLQVRLDPSPSQWGKGRDRYWEVKEKLPSPRRMVFANVLLAAQAVSKEAKDGYLCGAIDHIRWEDGPVSDALAEARWQFSGIPWPVGDLEALRLHLALESVLYERPMCQRRVSALLSFK